MPRGPDGKFSPKTRPMPIVNNNNGKDFLERQSPKGSSVESPTVPPVVLGEHFTIQASANTLRSQISGSYWCPEIEQICDGKMAGVAVRYTGSDVVLIQFRPDTISPAGRRYPFCVSIPQKYLVPVPHCRRNNSAYKGSCYAMEGTLPHEGIARVQEMCPFEDESPTCSLSSFVPHMCVVCGLVNQAGEMRKHGYKCYSCIGRASSQRLRDEAQRLETATPTPSSVPTFPSTPVH